MNSFSIIYTNTIFLKSLSSFSIIRLLDSVVRPFLAMILISFGPEIFSLLCLKYSLIILFILLRSTAFPTFFDTVMPIRLFSVPWSTIPIKQSVCTLLPCFESVKNWGLFKSLIFFGKQKLLNKSLYYTLRLFLPFALLALITRLPPGVAILFRKPCFLVLFRLLGWNVRFITLFNP